MLIAIHGVKLNAHCFKLLLIPIDGVKLYAHSETWSEALCSLLYMV